VSVQHIVVINHITGIHFKC